MITSGIYFRVKRDGKYDAYLFEELTDKERKDILAHKDQSFVIDLASKLADLINDVNKHLG